MDEVGTPVFLVRNAYNQMLAFHIVNQSGHAGLVLEGSVAEFLLCYPVFFPEEEQDGPLFRSDFHTVLSEIPAQLAINGCGNFSVQNREYKLNVKTELFDHGIIV